jgi:hypothetical protein
VPSQNCDKQSEFSAQAASGSPTQTPFKHTLPAQQLAVSWHSEPAGLQAAQTLPEVQIPLQHSASLWQEPVAVQEQTPLLHTPLQQELPEQLWF